MSLEDLLNLYDYCHWANHRLLTAVARLTPSEFIQPVGGSYGSVRNTFVHSLSAEWGWLERCGGHPRGPRLQPDAFPDIESIAATSSRVEEYVRTFLSTLTDSELTRTIEYTIYGPETHRMPLGELMQHAAIHGIHHRGQIALLVRMLGRSPGDFDFLFYAYEQRGIRAH